MRYAIVLVLAAALVAQAAPSAQAPARSTAPLYFPAGESAAWAALSPAQEGWKPEALENAFHYVEQANSSGIVVLYHGRILSERYWNPKAARVGSTSEGWPIEDVASLQKSLVSVLIGIGIDRGLVQRDAPVSRYLKPGWSKAPRDAEARITVNHLLTMTSGLTQSLDFEGAPGTRWFYNTPAYSRLIKVLEAASGKEANTYTTEWLTARLGMKDTRWIVRQGPSASVNPYGLATTARDLARLGLLMLSGGLWRDERIVSEPYLREAVKPSQALNPSYGLLWYANRRQARPAVQPHLSVAAAPDDLIAGQGAGQRRIYVVPSKGLVVARLGGPAGARFDDEFWTRFRDALPR